MTETTMTATDRDLREANDGYPQLEALIRARVAGAKGPLFTTDSEGLYDLFLANLPTDRRQHYDCRCCRAFVERYGGLATMGTEMAGETIPLLWWPWMDLPETFKEAGIALVKAVSKARVTGVFLSSDQTWGTPENVAGPGSKYVGQRWSHLSGMNPSVYKGSKTAEQRMAELKEDRGVLSRGLAEYDRQAAVEALRVLKADALDRSEKAVPIAEWFLDLHTRLEGVRNKVQRENIVWLAVATAPPGFAHVKNTVIGTLLEDIKEGHHFDVVKARWAKKIHPLQYQRPQTLKEGQIEAAEKLVERLGVAKSLDRRYCRLAEVPESAYIWLPKGVHPGETEKPAGSVFGHLKAKGKPDVKPLALPAVTMTWVKFARDVLPTAIKLELDPPPTGSYFGLVTAVNQDDPPVLQWDGLEWIGDPDHDTWPRNPVSWYFYSGGSTAWHWGLKPDLAEVTAVLRKPPHWQRPDQFKKESEAAFLVLRGAREQKEHRGGGLFPEILRTDLREARAAIEARTNTAVIAGHEGSDANGYALEAGSKLGVSLHVTAADGVREYRIDRWE